MLDLAGGLQIRRSLVMGAYRVELTGFSDGAVPQLEGARPHLGDHRLAPAALRADRRRSRPGDPRRDLRAPSASARPMPAPRPDREMRRDQRTPPIWRAASRAMPRPCAAITSPTDAARGRYWIAGDVDEHAGPQPLCPSAGSRLRSRRRRQMDRCRHRRAWRSPRPDRAATAICTALARPWTRRVPFSPCRALPRTAAAHRPRRRGSPEAARRLFRAGRPIPGTPAEAYLRARGITGRLDWPALRYHPSVYYRASRRRSARAVAGPARRRHRSRRHDHRHPAHLARSAAGRPRRRSPIRAGRSAICSATACASASAADILAAGEGVETMLALKSVLPLLPMVAGLSANHLAALDLPPALRRLYVARDNDAAGLKAADRLRERGTPPASMSASSCPSMATSTSTSAVSAPTACSRTLRTSSSRPTGRDFCPIIAAPMRSGESSRCGSPGVAPEGRTAFVCGGGAPVPEERAARRPSRAAICRRRRAAKRAALSRFATARNNYFPPPPEGGGFASRSKIVAPRHPPLRCGPAGAKPSPPPAKGSP